MTTIEWINQNRSKYGSLSATFEAAKASPLYPELRRADTAKNDASLAADRKIKAALRVLNRSLKRY